MPCLLARNRYSFFDNPILIHFLPQPVFLNQVQKDGLRPVAYSILKLRGSEPGQQIFLVFPEICFANYPGSPSKCTLTASLGVQYSTEGSEGVPTAHAFGGYWTFIILPEAPDDLKSHICILQSLIAISLIVVRIIAQSMWRASATPRRF
jgi:hypothetical protein